MIGLQRSSGLTTDRKSRHNLNYQSSSSSSSSSSLPTPNIRLMNTFKQQENKKWSQDTNSNSIILQQQIYPRQHSSRIFHLIVI